MFEALNINLQDQLFNATELLALKDKNEAIQKLKYKALEKKLSLIENQHEADRDNWKKNKKQEKRKAFLVGSAVGAVVVLVVGLLI